MIINAEFQEIEKSVDADFGVIKMFNKGGTTPEADTTFYPTIPEFIKTSAEDFAEKVKSHQSPNTFSFAFITDVHISPVKPESIVSAKHCGQALSIANKLVPLDFVVHGGDFTWGENDEDRLQTETDFNLYHQYISSATPNVPNIYCMGNHDDMPYQPTESRMTQRETFSAFGWRNLLPNAVIPKDSNGEYKHCNYGYVDFESQKVRVIFIDTEDKRFLKSPVDHYIGADGKAKRFLNFHNVTKQQLDFIVEKALNFSDKSDFSQWSIVVVSHLNINAGVDWWRYDDENCRCLVNSVAGVLNAYKTGTSYTVDITSANTDGTYSVVSGAKYDFTNTTNRVQNIIAVHGDSHIFEKDLLDGDIWSIGCPITCDGREGKSDDGNTYYKTPNTAEGTSFCVITIDKESQNVYADCYGAGYDREWNYTNYFNHEKRVSNKVIDDSKARFDSTTPADQDTRLKYGRLATEEGFYTTEFIPVLFEEGKDYATIRVNGINMYVEDYVKGENDNTFDIRRIALYTHRAEDRNVGKTYNVDTCIWCGAGIHNNFAGVKKEMRPDKNGVEREMFVEWQIPKVRDGKEVKYIRLCSDVMDDDAFITFNTTIPDTPDTSIEPEPTPEPETPVEPETLKVTIVNGVESSVNLIANTRMGGSGQDAGGTESTGFYTTNYIEIPETTANQIKVHIENIGLYLKTGDSTNDWRRLAIYTSDASGNKTILLCTANLTSNFPVGLVTKTDNEGYNRYVEFIIPVTPNAWGGNTPTHIRFCSDEIGTNSVITFVKETE